MRGNAGACAARHPALLGVDLAGNSVTSVVTDLAGRVLAKAGAPVALSRPRPGWVEVDPLDWLAATIVAVRRAVDEAGVRPAAIGLSGQPHGLVLIDEAGRPVRPAILRPDAWAVLRLAAYRDLPDSVRRRLVNPLSPAMAGPMLSWIATHEPASWARTRWALQPKDWLRAQLAGNYRSEPSVASATLLYDLLAEEWSADAAQRLGLDPGRLPEILPGAGHQAGLLTRSGADMIDLQPSTPIAAGAARTAAAALGAGLADGSCAQVVLGPCTHVIASIPALSVDLGRPLEVAVLNAGIAVGGAFADIDLAQDLALIDLSVKSVVHLAKRVVVDMIPRRRGRILMTSSVPATQPTPYETTYGPSRAFVYMFAEGLRAEVLEHGITVTALLPGATDSDFHARAGMGDTKFGDNSWKNDKRLVARQGVDALFAGKDAVVGGNRAAKFAVLRNRFLPERVNAERHARAARPSN